MKTNWVIKLQPEVKNSEELLLQQLAEANWQLMVKIGQEEKLPECIQCKQFKPLYCQWGIKIGEEETTENLCLTCGKRFINELTTLNKALPNLKLKIAEPNYPEIIKEILTNMNQIEKLYYE